MLRVIGASIVTVALAVYWHPPDVVTVTVYVPAAFTVVDCAVDPLDHRKVCPVPVTLAVKVVVEPWQNERLPVIVKLGSLFWTMVTETGGLLQVPFVTVRV
jgi:hypothetical protein